MNLVALQMLTGDRAKFCSKLVALCVALFVGSPLYGQSELAATESTGRVLRAASVAAQAGYTSDSQSQNPYLGGVPTGTASPTALSLSLEDAVARGLRQNLGGCFLPMQSPAHKASGGRHSARCCQI